MLANMNLQSIMLLALLTCIVVFLVFQFVTHWIRYSIDPVYRIHNSLFASVLPIKVIVKSERPEYYNNSVDAAANGKLHNLSGEDGGSGFYI